MELEACNAGLDKLIITHMTIKVGSAATEKSTASTCRCRHRRRDPSVARVKEPTQKLKLDLVFSFSFF